MAEVEESRASKKIVWPVSLKLVLALKWLRFAAVHYIYLRGILCIGFLCSFVIES